MERYDYLSYRVAKQFEKDKIAVRFRKITSIIDDIDELEEEVDSMYRNFKYKNLSIILLNLSIFKKSIELISRDYGGGVSDVNLMRKIAKNLDDLTNSLNNLTNEEATDQKKKSPSEIEFDGYKDKLRKIHLKIKKLA